MCRPEVKLVVLYSEARVCTTKDRSDIAVDMRGAVHVNQDIDVRSFAVAAQQVQGKTADIRMPNVVSIKDRRKGML